MSNLALVYFCEFGVFSPGGHVSARFLEGFLEGSRTVGAS